MTHIEIEESLKQLNCLAASGRLLEAFDKFYHDDVVMQENNQPATITKVENRKRELEFLENVTEFRKAEVKGMTAGDDTSCVIWSYDYTHKDWGVRNYTQVSVQQWRDGKIIKEQFIYDN